MNPTLVEEITGTSRLLVLNSMQADHSYSPTHKMFRISDHLKSGAQFRHKLVMKALSLPHVFLGQPDSQVLYWKTNPATSQLNVAIIEAGNRNAVELAIYLTKQFMPYGGPKVWFDSCAQKFIFQPSIYIVNPSTVSVDDTIPSKTYKMLGYPPDFQGVLTSSLVPIDLNEVYGIRVMTNLSIHQLPVSGEIAYVPIPTCTCFGSRVEYYDDTASDYALVMDEQISRITIMLCNQDGRPLEEMLGYTSKDQYGFQDAVPNWTIVFKIITIPNTGWSQLPLPLVPVSTSTIGTIEESSDQTETEK